MKDIEKLKFMKENTLDTDYIKVYDNKLNIIGYKSLREIRMYDNEELFKTIVSLKHSNNDLSHQVDKLQLEVSETKQLLKKIIERMNLRWKK